METYNTDRPNNYMVLAIISAVLGCCSPCGIGFILGIVAIYFASQVNSRVNSGDIFGAESASKNARIIALIAIAIAVLNLIYIAYIFTFQPEIYQEQLDMIRRAIEEAKAAQ